MSLTLITWLKNGGMQPVTLGDDANKLTIELGDVSQECVVQKESLAFAPNPFLAARGNNSGQFSFTSTNTYPTIDAMITALKAELQRCNQSGTLIFLRGATKLTMAGAVLRNVKRASGSEGVKLRIAYQFDITTIA